MHHAEIVGSKGSRLIAETLGIPANRVRVWKHRNVIPRSAWAELIDAFPDITLDLLKSGESRQ